MYKVVFIAAFMAATASTAPIDTSKLRFKISARNLPNKDKVLGLGSVGVGTIDPFVEIFYVEDGKKDEVSVGRTATLTDQENPDWGDVFEFDFNRAKQQRWHFKVYDHDNLREDDEAGEAYVDVADFVDKNQQLNLNLNKKGYLIISTVDPVTPAPVVIQPGTVFVPQTGGHLIVNNSPSPPVVVAPSAPVIAPGTIHTTNPLARIKFRLSASGLDDKDVIGTSDPKVKVYSKIGSEPEQLVGRTATLDDTENPVWPESIDFEYDPTKQPKLRFLILDDDEGRRDDELGEAWLDVNEYVQKNQDMTISLKKGSLNIRKA